MPSASAAPIRPRPIGPDRRGRAGREPTGPFLDDGTLLKPVAVDTTVADGAARSERYKVKAGDTLTGIAQPLRRLDDDRLVGEQAQVEGRRSTSART